MLRLPATPIGRLRVVGILEGASFLLLLGVAVPLKHAWGLPLGVRIVGPIHGALFLGFCVLLVQAMAAHDWPFKRVLSLFVAALLPFGPFFIDARLRREDEASGMP